MNSFPLLEIQKARLLFLDEPGIAKGDAAILAYYDVVKDFNLANYPSIQADLFKHWSDQINLTVPSGY